MIKPHVMFQNNQHKTVVEVTQTKYPLSIHSNSKTPEKGLSSTCGKSKKNNLRIISKPHAHFQTMTKTPVKFRKNRHKTVGGVAHTRYLLLKGDGSAPRYGATLVRNAEYYVPHFSSKRRGTKSKDK